MYKKTYLSRAMTRAFAMDAPIGDPFGGPAFGERNDPVSTVVAFFEAATVFEAVAAIGTALSVVGMVTGNESLTKIGGVMGLVGGFGTLAQNGVFGEGMKGWADGISNSMSTNISSAAVPTDAFANGEVVQQSIAGGATAPVDAGSLNLEQTTNAGLISDTAAGYEPALDMNPNATSRVDPLSKITIDGDPASNMLNPDGTPKVGTTPAASTPLDIAKAGEPINAMQSAAQQGGNVSAVAKAASTGIDTGTSLLDRIGKFADKHPVVSMEAAKFIKGLMPDPLKDAQVKQADATTALYDARVTQMQKEGVNANAVPNVGGMTVNPNAQIYNPRGPVAAGPQYAGFIQRRA